MKKRIIQAVVVILFCMTLLIVAYNNQKGSEDTVQVSESGNIPVESDEVIQSEQEEEYMKDFTTFYDVDYYDIVDNSIVSKDLVESVDNYIKNEIDVNSYDYVRVVGFGYNPTYHESSIELIFDSNEYRYIIVSDSNPNDISIIYNYPMTDFQLSCLGLKED